MKATARRMILLMQRINKENFGGAPIVTCYTCHRGDMRPEGTPSLAVQYGTPIIDPDAIEINKQAAGAPSAAELFDKYIQAVGGSQRVAAVASFAAKGTYNGYDTEFENVPIEIYGKAPAQRATVIHFRSGDSITTYDGRAGWISEADKPVPLIELTGDELEGALVDGTLLVLAKHSKAASKETLIRILKLRDLGAFKGSKASWDGERLADCIFEIEFSKCRELALFEYLRRGESPSGVADTF